MEINKFSETVYSDFPIIKQTLGTGELKTYKNSDALTQAIKIWLVSGKGEKVRSTTGGVLSPYIGKLLDEDLRRKIKQEIQNALLYEFSPPITIVSLEVQGDGVNQSLSINIVGYNADLAVGVNTSVVVSPY